MHSAAHLCTSQVFLLFSLESRPVMLTSNQPPAPILCPSPSRRLTTCRLTALWPLGRVALTGNPGRRQWCKLTQRTDASVHSPISSLTKRHALAINWLGSGHIPLSCLSCMMSVPFARSPLVRFSHVTDTSSLARSDQVRARASGLLPRFHESLRHGALLQSRTINIGSFNVVTPVWDPASASLLWRELWR